MVSIYHDTRKIKQDGTYPVRIRVTYKRQARFFPTGKSISIKDWNLLPKTRVPELVAVRQDIEHSFSLIREIIRDMQFEGSFSFEKLNLRLGRGQRATLNDSMMRKMSDLESSGKIGTA